jgi:hypothetical protein
MVYRVNPREGYTPLTMMVIMKIKWQLERLMRFIKMMNCRVHLI